MLRLSNNEIHLWFTSVDKITNTDLLSRYPYYLSNEEHQRWQQFNFQKHQHQYLITRALVRTTLSRYATTRPEDWQFSKNEYGKPEIIPSQNLFFNLSHTETLIVCAVSREANIGIDIETIQHKTRSIAIAQRFFSTIEVTALLQCPLSQQRSYFFQLWTLKEAYIKACGQGLSLPLKQFSWTIDKNKRKLTLRVDSQLKTKPQHWQCWLLQANADHYAALCIFNPRSIVYSLQTQDVVPLKEELAFNYRLLAMS
jgi:4'-phosphopantetheinyl transferase